jgi:DNA-binding transcriptional ArsR family regulator
MLGREQPGRRRLMMETSKECAALKALGHPECLQILKILAQEEACVSELVNLTGKRQPYVSQQLMTLRRANLVISERRSQNIYYHINFSQLEELGQIIANLLIHNPALKK